MSKNRLHKNKKAAVFGHWIFTTILIIVLLWWFIGFVTRDCRKNTDCPTDSYCDYRFTCQKIPVVEKNYSKDFIKQNAFFYLLIGAAIGGMLTYYYMKNELGEKLKKQDGKIKASAADKQPISSHQKQH